MLFSSNFWVIEPIRKSQIDTDVGVIREQFTNWCQIMYFFSLLMSLLKLIARKEVASYTSSNRNTNNSATTFI